jgi:hypothetical protein
MTLLSLKEFVGFHETEENFTPFEATPTHNIKFPTRSCVNLSYRSFICDPDIVCIKGSFSTHNVKPYGGVRIPTDATEPLHYTSKCCHRNFC